MELFNLAASGGGGGGDVTGPVSSVDNAIPLFNGTTGKLIKMSNTLVGNDSAIDYDVATPATFDPTKYSLGVYNDGAIFPFGQNAPTGSGHKWYVGLNQIFSINEFQLRVTTSPSIGAAIPSLNWEVSTSVNIPSELNNIFFNLAPVGGQNFASGTIPLQREFRIAAPTYSGGAPGTTLSKAVTASVDGPPDQGSNTTIGVAVGFEVGYKQLSCTSSVGANFAPSGITNGIGTTGVHAGISVFNSSSVALGNQAATTSYACSIYLPQLQWSAITNTRTVTNLATLYIANSPSISGTVAVTNGPYSIFVDAGSTRLDGRLLLNQGAGISSANDLTLGSDGFYFIITGTTTLQRIATSGYTSGTLVTLGFTNTLTIQHGVASGGGFSGFECPYGLDVSCENGTEIILRYSSARDSWAVMSIMPPA